MAESKAHGNLRDRLWEEQLKRRTIYLCGYIDEHQAELTSLAISKLIWDAVEEYKAQNEAEREITVGDIEEAPLQGISIFLDTPGGRVESCWHIVDSIRQCRCPVSAVARGQVCSGGLMIYAACDYRISSPFTSFMAHGALGRVGWLTEPGAEQSKEALQAINEQMAGYLAEACSWKKSGRNASTWLKWMQSGEDHYFTAEQAQRFGLVHEIM